MMPRRLPATMMPTALMILAAIAGAAPAAAAQSREPSPAERYVRLRAASSAGDFETATSQLAILMARDPANDMIAQRAFRGAIGAGDRPLALRAARLLEQQKKLPADAPLLFLIDAVQAKDWPRARAEVDRLETGKLFAFMGPILRAWIAVGAKDADPLALIAPAQSGGLGSAYYPAQHGLLLLATGQTDAGVAAIAALPEAGSRLRIAAAAALQRAHEEEGIAALLTGPEPALAVARARVASGQRLEPLPETAAAGIAELYTQVALDFDRQRLSPVALMLARLATFADPANSGAWIATANLLAARKTGDAVLAALSHVKPDDPYAGAAQTLKVALLVDRGDKPAALAEARADAERPGAGPADWSRFGEAALSLDEPAQAADAFAHALAALGADAPPAAMWPLLLQRGAALEQAGNWPEAKAALERAYALAPDQAIVLNHLGYSLLARREDLPRATKLIAAANQLRPGDPAITDSLGWATFVSGDPSAAAPLLERASLGDPGEPTINEHLGDVYWALGRHIEARYAWRAALVTADAKDMARIRSKIDSAPTPATAAP